MIVTALLIVLMKDGRAWGPEGHAATGILAIRSIDASAHSALEQVLGTLDDERIDEWCNWPDTVEDDRGWEWARPQHYVNIPRRTLRYDAQRDCPEGLCVTEAIKKYAGQLMDDRLSPERRTQAFAWLCHLVGDLHQPLHCGFADDRGGNSLDVVFDGKELNLHQFWDRHLILREAGSRAALLSALELAAPVPVDGEWSPGEVDAWTEESHELAATVGYPDSPAIDEHFARESWAFIRQRMPLGAYRLARILNATLGSGDVRVEPAE